MVTIHIKIIKGICLDDDLKVGNGGQPLSIGKKSRYLTKGCGPLGLFLPTDEGVEAEGR